MQISVDVAQVSCFLYGVTLNITDLYGEKYGMGIVLAGGNAGVGRYKMA